jgi:hypothetical protein
MVPNGHDGDSEHDGDPELRAEEPPPEEEQRPARQPSVYRGYGNYGQVAIGVGMRIGPPALFVRDREMPRLHPQQVALACDNLVAGELCYTSLVYLSRARVEDTATLFRGSESAELRVRWERLWVLSPYLAKLARTAEGRTQIAACMGEDLAAVHLLSKFAEQRNSSVQRLFKRMHDELLALLLPRLAEFRDDPRRAALLASIIAAVETDAETIDKLLDAHVGAQVREQIVPFLTVRQRDPRLSKLSSEILRDKLERWGRE